MTNINSSLEERKSLVANLIKLAQADGEVAKGEIIFIQSIALKLQITGDEFDAIMNDLDSVNTVVPTDQKEALRQFYYLLSLMNMDLNADQSEKDFAYKIGTKLRLPSQKVHGIIEWMAGKVNTPVNVTMFEEAFENA